MVPVSWHGERVAFAREEGVMVSSVVEMSGWCVRVWSWWMMCGRDWMPGSAH